MDRHLESAPTLGEVLDEVMTLLSQESGEMRQEGEFTVAEFAEHHGIGYDAAYKRLKQGAKKGILGKRRGRGGRNWYHKI